MDSKSSSSGAPSDLCFYRRNREAAQRLLCKYEDRQMSIIAVSPENYICQLFACLLGENYYSFNHCYSRIKMHQKLKPSIKLFELLMQIGAANYQNNMTHAVSSLTLFEKLKDLSQEVKDLIQIYKQYLATKIVILYIVGYDRFREKELLILLNGLGFKEIESVGANLDGFDPGILSYDGKKGERWVEVKRELADAFLETYDPSIVKADIEDIKNLVDVMKVVENSNDWRVDVANQAASEYRLAFHDEPEHDSISHLLSSAMGPMRMKHFR